MHVAGFRVAGYGGVVARALRAGRFAIIGFEAVIVAAGLAVVAVIGVVLLTLWLREPSANAYARTHVQALFVDHSMRRTGTVKTCKKVGPGDEPGQEIWSCRVAGNGCVGTFTFAVDHEYGTAPYDSRSADATTSPCRITNDR